MLSTAGAPERRLISELSGRPLEFVIAISHLQLHDGWSDEDTMGRERNINHPAGIYTPPKKLTSREIWKAFHNPHPSSKERTHFEFMHFNISSAIRWPLNTRSLVNTRGPLGLFSISETCLPNCFFCLLILEVLSLSHCCALMHICYWCRVNSGTALSSVWKFLQERLSPSHQSFLWRGRECDICWRHRALKILHNL